MSGKTYPEWLAPAKATPSSKEDRQAEQMARLISIGYVPPKTGGRYGARCLGGVPARTLLYLMECPPGAVLSVMELSKALNVPNMSATGHLRSCIDNGVIDYYPRTKDSPASIKLARDTRPAVDDADLPVRRSVVKASDVRVTKLGPASVWELVGS